METFSPGPAGGRGKRAPPVWTSARKPNPTRPGALAVPFCREPRPSLSHRPGPPPAPVPPRLTREPRPPPRLATPPPSASAPTLPRLGPCAHAGRRRGPFTAFALSPRWRPLPQPSAPDLERWSERAAGTRAMDGPRGRTTGSPLFPARPTPL